MIVEPITLPGRFVRLEPLSEAHVPDLEEAGKDPRIWQYMLYGDVSQPSAMTAWVRKLLALQAQGTDLPFAVVHLEHGGAIGSTRYLEIRADHRGLEIGGTWYAPAFQGTLVNKECKYLLLRHAFEGLGCVRVQFKTDARNSRSQKALEGIGAIKEGILRQHIITPSGYIRDSIYYSILDREWPAVKQKLELILFPE